MEPYAINPWIFAAIGVLSLVLNAGLAWLVWVRKPGEEAAQAVVQTSERVAELLREHQAAMELRMHDHHGRISQLEIQLKHMPTADELRRLDAAVQVMAERATGLQESMRGMRASLGRIEQWMMEMKFLRNVPPHAPDSRL